MVSIPLSHVGRYGGAVVLASIALVATLQLEIIASQTPFALFFGAVAAAAWLLGRGPGLLAEVLSATGVAVFVVPHLTSAQIEPPRYFQFGVFILAGIVLVWGVSSVRRYLRRANELDVRFASLFEKNPFPVWIVNEKTGRFVAVNAAALEVYGYTQDEFLDLTIKDIGSDLPAGSFAERRANSDRRTAPITVAKHTRKDGSSLYVELVSQDLSGEMGNCRLVHAIDITERIRTSKLLETSEARLLKVFGAAPIAIAVSRWEDRTFLDINPEYAELTGWTLEQLKGRTAAECGLVTGRTEAEIREQLERHNTLVEQEIEITTRNGKKRNVILGIVFAEMHGEQCVVSSLINITELRRAEQRAAEVEDRLRLVTEKARVGLMMVSESRRFTFANNAYAEIFGIQAGQITGRRVSEVHPELFDNQIGPSLDRAFAGQSFNFELKQDTPAGTRYFDVRYEPSVSGGTQRSVVAVVTDITPRVNADLARDASEERYRTLFEYSPDGIAIADRSSRYIDANETLCSMLGYAREEFVGLRAPNLYVPREVPHLRQTLYGLNDDLDYYQEWQVRRKDGSTLPVEVVATKMPDGNTLTVIRDITDRKKLEDQLLQAQKMEAIGVLAGGVAHDFNNILTAISGYSELALQNLGPDDPNRDYILEIGGAGERAAALTRQLLSFSRRGRSKPEVHNLNDAIRETERMLRRIVKANIEFKLDLAHDLNDIRIDQSHVSQVIVNLVVNAGDAMPEGGTLTISTRNRYLVGDLAHDNIVVNSGDYVELSVRDTGIGMDDETKRRLFEPFFTTKEMGRGTGLGLATVYGIVKALGGDVDVESKVREGSTFRVFFPSLPKSDQVAEANDAADRAVPARGTILLVEDEDSVRSLVENVLTRNGFDVIASEGGEAALSVCHSYAGSIELLLTDMIMPGLDGLTLFRKVREIRPSIAATIMSGYTGEALEKAMLLEPGISFIGKPFSPDELVAAVSKSVEAAVPVRVEFPKPEREKALAADRI